VTPSAARGSPTGGPPAATSTVGAGGAGAEPANGQPGEASRAAADIVSGVRDSGPGTPAPKIAPPKVLTSAGTEYPVGGFRLTVRRSDFGSSLSIDAALQDEVEQVIAGVGAQYQPKGATAIVMDPRSGAILALANWPKANPNSPAGAAPQAFWDQAVGLNYEPGSTFKAITVAGALQDGFVTPDTRFDVPSVLQVADRQIHDAESHGDENLSVADILRVSSNIGADEIGMKVGARRFDYWVHRFGFGASPGIALPGEERVGCRVDREAAEPETKPVTAGLQLAALRPSVGVEGLDRRTPRGRLLPAW